MGLISRFVGSLVGAAATAVAGAYVVGKLVKEDELEAEEKENVEVLKPHLEETEVVKKEVAEVDEIKLTTKPFEEVKIETYAHLSDQKKSSIKKQIGVMLETAPKTDKVDLNHYIVFSDANKANDFAKIASNEDFVITKDEKAPLELHLEKSCPLDRDVIEELILKLADDSAIFGGDYKGWTVKAE